MHATVQYTVFASLLALFAVTSGAHADPGSPSTLGGQADGPGSAPENQWSGKFAYAGGQSQRAAIARAIERATAEMGPLSRHIARLRLEQETRPNKRLRIEVDDRMVGVAAESMWKSPVDGTVRVVRDADGGSFRVSQHLDGRRIFQEIRDDSLVIRNVLALSEDGSEVSIRVRVHHERIPEPLAYHLTYRRIE